MNVLLSHRRAGLVATAVIALVAALTVSLGGGTASRAEGPADAVRLNQIQTIGSHNSYHLVPPPEELALRSLFTEEQDLLMQYEHDPLPVQFSDQAVRQIELDVFVDTAGGTFAEPFLRTIATPDADPMPPEMFQPGIKVLHVQDVDYASTCLTLVACLTQVKQWSDANPHHVPLAVLVELKEGDPSESGFIPPGVALPFAPGAPWTAPRLDELDAEIRSVFSPGDLIVPDDVRGGHATLEEAILTDGWPTLADSRGKVMFLMDNGGGHRTTYLQGHPSLAGRVLFTNSSPGNPDAAFVKRNNAFDSSIPGLVEAGYLVRTRADAETIEARSNDTTKRDAALASGAQWVSTDYPVPDMGFGFDTAYHASIPGGTVARCNPINAPVACDSTLLESPDGPDPIPSTSTTTPAPGPGGSSSTTLPPTSGPEDPPVTDPGEDGPPDPSPPTTTAPSTTAPPPTDRADDGGRRPSSSPAPAARPRLGRTAYTG